MKFRLLTVTAAAAMLAGCTSHESTINAERANNLCGAFWIIENADSVEIQAQLSLLDTLDNQGPHDVITVDTAPARKASEAADKANLSSRLQLLAVCGAPHG